MSNTAKKNKTHHLLGDLSELLGQEWKVSLWPELPDSGGKKIALVAEELDSTQDRLDEKLLYSLSPNTEALLLYTHRQTAGHGREGRTWFSPGESGLAFSLALRVKNHRPPGHWPLLVGWAKARSLASWVPIQQLDLKWPNDLLLKGKKLSGSLCSMHQVGHDSWIRMGIGMNIGSMDFPDELMNVATSLAEHITPPSREEVLVATVESLLEDLEGLDAKDLLRNYSGLCTIAHDAHISWKENNLQHTGITKGLDSDGALLCEENGRRRPLHVSEIQHLRPKAV